MGNLNVAWALERGSKRFVSIYRGSRIVKELLSEFTTIATVTDRRWESLRVGLKPRDEREGDKGTRGAKKNEKGWKRARRIGKRGGKREGRGGKKARRGFKGISPRALSRARALTSPATGGGTGNPAAP